MESDIRVVDDEPTRGWRTELSDVFRLDEVQGWVLDPLRWAAHPAWVDDHWPPSDPRSLLTA